MENTHTFLHLALWYFLARGESCFGFVYQYVDTHIIGVEGSLKKHTSWMSHVAPGSCSGYHHWRNVFHRETNLFSMGTWKVKTKSWCHGSVPAVSLNVGHARIGLASGCGRPSAQAAWIALAPKTCCLSNICLSSIGLYLGSIWFWTIAPSNICSCHMCLSNTKMLMRFI